MKTWTYLSLRLGIAMLLLGCAPLHGQFLYTAVNLGSLGGTSSEAYNVNDAGQVVGRSAIGSVGHSFLYTNGHMFDLTAGVFGLTDSKATGINSAGQVVGQINASIGEAQYGFLYSGGSLSALPGLSTASDINDSGDITGQNTTAYEQQATVFHTQGALAGTRTDIGVINGGPISWASDINNAGLVIGVSTTTTSPNLSFTAQAGTAWSRTTTSVNGGQTSFIAVNDNGQILGSTWSQPYILSGNTLTDLSGLGAGLGFRDLNDAGTVVGTQVPNVGIQYAVVYSGGQLRNLNTITDLSGTGFATLQEAVAISDTGYIVGYGLTTGGMRSAFLLTPTFAAVPEPATNALIAGCTLAGLAGWRSRRRIIAQAQRPTA